MDAIKTQMGELLESMVRKANSEAFKEYDRKLERLQELISDLKESFGMIQRQLRNAGVNLTPQPIIRTSSHDIRNLRKKLGITQSVFARIMHVNISTVIRWEKNLVIPHAKHKNQIRTLKMMDSEELKKLIQQAETALYE